jgi:hypothetical protein
MPLKFEFFVLVCVLFLPSVVLSKFNVLESIPLRDFFQLKAGQLGHQYLWHYSGTMRNPLTGSEIVGIEGLEVVCPITNTFNDHSSHSFGSVGYTSNGTFISKKVFLYTNISNRSEILSKYRLRVQAPFRKVVSSKSYNEKTTIGSGSRGHAFAVIEWPGTNRTLSTTKIKFSSLASAIDFGSFSRQSKVVKWLLHLAKSGKHVVNGVEVTNFMSSANHNQTPFSKVIAVNTTREKQPWYRRKWVSFASSNNGVINSDIGKSQEYYTLRKVTGEVAAGPDLGLGLGRPEVEMTYRRIGEGPSWYAPGRVCVTELHGWRYPYPYEKLKLYRSDSAANVLSVGVADRQRFSEAATDRADSMRIAPRKGAFDSIKAGGARAGVLSLVLSQEPDFFSVQCTGTSSGAGVSSCSDTGNTSAVECFNNKSQASALTPVDKGGAGVLRFNPFTVAKEQRLQQHEKKKQLLSLEWFHQQADPAARYRPWFSFALPGFFKLK